MNHASLFSGIGGFDLAAQWMGWNNVFQVEKDAFCQKVLAKNFPQTKRYGDIKEFDGTKYRGAVDIITGGFPCQPFSTAGKRLGTDDPRHLWPEMLRVVREIQPGWVVGENVFGIINWSKGLVFEMVCSDLENQGYQVTPVILPAAGVGAPHRRNRCWFIAYSNSNDARRRGYGETEQSQNKGKVDEKERKWIWPEPQRISQERTIANASSIRRIQGEPRHESGVNNEICEIGTWARFPTQSPIRIGNDGIPSGLVRSSIHAAGNAIVPQVAFQIFKAIEAITL